MKVKRHIWGFEVVLQIFWVKDYPRFSLYEICKDGKRLFYTTFTKQEINEIILKGEIK